MTMLEKNSLAVGWITFRPSSWHASWDSPGHTAFEVNIMSGSHRRGLYWGTVPRTW